MAPTIEERFWIKVDRTDDGCWLWNGATQSKGYGCFGPYLAHRYGYELQHGPIPEGMLVCHHCDTPRCVRGDHLFLGTHQDNMADMVAKQRAAAGDQNCNARAEVRRKKSASGKRAMNTPEMLALKSDSATGERNHFAKLDDQKVREIRILRKTTKLSLAAIGDRYGVTRDTISNICRRVTWDHVSD